jgi:signal transduction histidine kinase
VKISYSPYRDDNNRIIGVIANTRDITSRKKGEELFKARLRISIEVTAEVGNYRLSVADNGVGLPPALTGAAPRPWACCADARLPPAWWQLPGGAGERALFHLAVQ